MQQATGTRNWSKFMRRWPRVALSTFAKRISTCEASVQSRLEESLQETKGKEGLGKGLGGGWGRVWGLGLLYFNKAPFENPH